MSYQQASADERVSRLRERLEEEKCCGMSPLQSHCLCFPLRQGVIIIALFDLFVLRFDLIFDLLLKIFNTSDGPGEKHHDLESRWTYTIFMSGLVVFSCAPAAITLLAAIYEHPKLAQVSTYIWMLRFALNIWVGLVLCSTEPTARVFIGVFMIWLIIWYFMQVVRSYNLQLKRGMAGSADSRGGVVGVATPIHDEVGGYMTVSKEGAEGQGIPAV